MNVYIIGITNHVLVSIGSSYHLVLMVIKNPAIAFWFQAIKVFTRSFLHTTEIDGTYPKG